MLIIGIITAILGFFASPEFVSELSPFSVETSQKIVTWAKFIGAFVTLVSGFVVVKRQMEK